MSKEQAKQALIEKRKKFRKRNPNKTFKFKRPVAAIYPRVPERALIKDLRRLIKSVERNASKVLMPFLDRFIDEETTKLRTDSEELAELIKVEMFEDWDDEIIQDIIETRFAEAEGVNAAQISAQFKSLLGVEPFVRGTYIDGLMASHVSETAGLITSIRDGTQGDIERIVLRAVRTGKPNKEVANDIRQFLKGSIKKMESRSRLIARDQMGSFNSNLTRLKNKELGVKRYVWRTAKDERVRGNPSGLYPNSKPSHHHKEGQIFSWDIPPVGGHPGQPIQCRCYAEPVLESIDE